MGNIRHLLFDLGGVLLNLDFQRTIKAFTDAGFKQFEEWSAQNKLPQFFADFEKGKLSKTKFFNEINRFAEKPLSAEEITNNWNAMLLDFPLRRLQILEQLRIHFDLILVSNTNEIHEACFNQKIKQQTGLPGIPSFFDRVYYSHRTGLRKPDPKVFEKVLAENQLAPVQTLFIDDSFENTAAAKQLGIQTIWLKEGMTIEKDVFKPKDTQH